MERGKREEILRQGLPSPALKEYLEKEEASCLSVLAYSSKFEDIRHAQGTLVVLRELLSLWEKA